jgi:hypothetical protein
MGLQEQLMDREQTIEELKQRLSAVDEDAPGKIIKRDDEISWLRELLAVRHSDLQDVIEALGGEAGDMNQERVREAAIRLKANLEMEEAERERAMNGGSAITVPNIAQTIRDAASPRAQELGTRVMAAWDNWRKGSTSGLTTVAAASAQSTPTKAKAASEHGFLSGLLTPPSSSMRPMLPISGGAVLASAFAATTAGQRFTMTSRVSNGRRSSQASSASSFARNIPMVQTAKEASSPSRKEPGSHRDSGYDSDAQAGDFDDGDFFDDDE